MVRDISYVTHKSSKQGLVKLLGQPTKDVSICCTTKPFIKIVTSLEHGGQQFMIAWLACTVGLDWIILQHFVVRAVTIEAGSPWIFGLG